MLMLNIGRGRTKVGFDMKITLHYNTTTPPTPPDHKDYLLSNSNPTWNSTELELVRVGVDFVFQCHNNKNPHLILIYRKGLQVYNLGRVTVWVSRSCLEGVWKVSGRCLEGVWKVSGRCLEGVWKVSRRCLEPYLSYPYQPN